MKRIKIFKNILAVAIAASMMFGCIALTGCDKKDDKKDSKKSEKVEDDDEDDDEDEDKDEKETKATEKETEETEEPDETEAEETEETEEPDETSDEDEINADDFAYETVNPDDIEDEYLKELANYYANEKNMTIVNINNYLGQDASELAEGIVDGFVGAPDTEASVSVSTDGDDASASGSMEMAMVFQFDTEEHALALFNDMNDIEESGDAMGLEITKEETDEGILVSGKTAGIEVTLTYNKEHKVINYYMLYDFNAMGIG